MNYALTSLVSLIRGRLYVNLDGFKKIVIVGQRIPLENIARMFSEIPYCNRPDCQYSFRGDRQNSARIVDQLIVFRELGDQD